MKFAVCTNKPAAKPTAVVKPQVAPVTPQDITEAYEGLMASYMELTDTQRNLDEVCQVMDNINLSMMMLQSGSADAVKLLNVDKSLESLLGVAEEKITVQAAEEGFADSIKAAWNKFWAFIKDFFRKVIAYIKMMFHNGIGWNGIDIKALQDKVNTIDVVADNTFKMHSNLFGGVLTLKAYEELPEKIEKFFACGNMLLEGTEEAVREYQSSLRVFLGGKSDSLDLFNQARDKFRNKMGEINKYLHERTRQIFGDVGQDINVGFFAFNFKLKNFILDSDPGYTKGQIFSASLKELGFGDKAAFQKAVAGFVKLNDVITKGDLSKVPGEIDKLSNNILAIQKLVEGMQAGLDDGKSLFGSSGDRAVFTMHKDIIDDVKVAYKVTATATSWLADAKAIKNAMDTQFRLMMNAAFSATSQS